MNYKSFKLYNNYYIPIKNIIHEKKVYFIANRTKKHYSKVEEKIKKRTNKSLNFAAFAVFDSTFGVDYLFKRMLIDKNTWNAKVVIIPDISRGYSNQIKVYEKTKKFFCDKYGAENVIDGWDINNNKINNVVDCFDIVYFANPYDSMVHKFHSIRYASKRKVLPIYISYGYDVGFYTTRERLRSLELNLVWKYFIDTKYSYEDLKKYQVIKGINANLAGYMKMDAYTNLPISGEHRLKILVATHHTVREKMLPLSNFLEYYDLLLKLPDMFPNIDFVFRPHPLLFSNLINKGIWSEDEVASFLSNLKNNGVIYSYEGDYLHLFSECDAIINDCGSFTVEWLYTGKPGCFVYNKELTSDKLTTLMNKSINEYWIAHSSDDIVSFINYIEKNYNQRTNTMKDWVKENIALNYPNVSECILKELRSII